MSATTCTTVRLTRRGRTLLVLLLAGLLLAAFSLGQQDTQAASVVGAQPELQSVVVQPGESLWSVAQRVAPDNDPREIVAQIRRLNDLETSSLQVGQHLLLPVAA
jgi:LysM repeat protein